MKYGKCEARAYTESHGLREDSLVLVVTTAQLYKIGGPFIRPSEI